MKWLGYIKITFFFRWYDLWIGAYVDVAHNSLYICPIPMCGVKIMLIGEHAQC